MQLNLVNQCFEFNTKYILTLETDMRKLFVTNSNQSMDASPGSIDADVVFTGVPYIMSKQFQLGDNFKTYLEGTLPTPYQKWFELVRGTESRVVGFTGANKQFFFCYLISVQ